ncbi:MAG: metal-dependent transcriptional regulator [Oscillospiraceae bacterium]|nr:metal-dependent transcriptional regulator [Oscillospiraceae bacterium]
MVLFESGEMYLETILILSKEKPFVRSIDVAEYMRYSKPSVSRAVGLLKNGGYITVSPEGHLELTEEGRKVAETIFERHTVLSGILIRLGVDPELASEDACKMEHYISDTSFHALKTHFENEGFVS